MHAESILAEHPAIDDGAVCKLKEELVLGIVLTEGEVPPSVDQINSTLKSNSYFCGLKIWIQTKKSSFKSIE